MNILVTGGAGYIGSNLVSELCSAGHRVTIVDNLRTGQVANVAAHLETGFAEFVHADVAGYDGLPSLVQAADLVFHLAAIVGVKHVLDDPIETIRTNVYGSERILELSCRYGKRVVLASTSEIYGRSDGRPLEEDAPRVLGPTTVSRWSYSSSKALAEHLALAYAERGLAVSVVRYFNSYGPRMHPSGYGGVVANFIQQALRGAPITVHGDGSQTRCFTFVADTVAGTIAAGSTPEAVGRIFNIGSTDEISIHGLAVLVRHLCGSQSDIVMVPHASFYGVNFQDTSRRRPEISKARRYLHWSPQTRLHDGLVRTITWWRDTYGISGRSMQATLLTQPAA
jgi:UDP-glucose 4-epimerase